MPVTCSKCTVPQNEEAFKKTHTDHCHSTGKVRGLLCSDCNKALGFVKDNVFIALGIAQYLKEHSNG